MVAAPAWDLRGARAAGMRTYLDRPGGDPPSPDDAFGLHLAAIGELAAGALSR